MTTLDTLEKLADAATPGPWNWHYRYGNIVIDGPESDDIARVHIGLSNLPSERKAKFIAAANPATIKALVALCRLQNQAIHELRTVINMMLEDRNGKCFVYAGQPVCDNEALAAYERFNKEAE